VSAVIPNYEEYEEQQRSAHPPSYSYVVHNSVSNIQANTPRAGPRLSSLRFAPDSTTVSRNTSGTQSVEQEAVDYVQDEPLQGYRSTLVHHFMQVKAPSVSSIHYEQLSLLRPLPEDGPAVDDALLKALYHEHVVARVAIDLPNRGSLKHANYV
jgi:hypothetical protein